MKIKRKYKIELRCTILEKKIIQNKAEKCGLKVSEYLRKVGQNQILKSKLTAEEIGIYKDLHKFHNNFVSIKNLLKNKDTAFANEVENTALELRKHLTKFL